ncbi:TPA: hypothetical protein ACWWDF_002801 [Enterococcus faecium]
MDYQEYETNEHKSATFSYADTFEQERPAVQLALIILWRIHTKRYQVGSRVFKSELMNELKVSDSNYKEALAFLEGAGAVVNEVVILDKVPQTLISRYGIQDE